MGNKSWLIILLNTDRSLSSKLIRPGKIDLQFIVKAFLKCMQVGGHFSLCKFII